MNWGGPAPLVFNLLLVTFVSEKCSKETETKETIYFFATFLSLVKFPLGAGPPVPPPLPPWLRLCSKWGKQKRCSQIFREVSCVFHRYFYCSKNSAVLEPRTRQFSRTWGFEAKAKGLTFKAKDFKMCPWGRPRNQGRPPGLHLWPLGHISHVFRAIWKPIEKVK